MEYSKLKEEIKEIGEIASSVPEAFREKCFEVLLNNLISGHTENSGKTPPSDPLNPTPPPESGNITLPSSVKAFIRKKNLTQEQIESIVMVENDEFHFIKEPTHGNIRKGQIEWSLLLALKNGILNNSIKIDPEDVRSIVQEKGYYDSANFASNFKKPNYEKLFRGLLERQGEPQSLTPDGETALADLVKELSGA